MRKSSVRLTAAQFARLHHVNKRTLHYYDSIGLFSPDTKGENGYRYYDLSQSIDFEYILMLKDLNMSLEEIREYWEAPDLERFVVLAEKKELEIQKQMKRLREMKKAIRLKKEQIKVCQRLKQDEISIVKCNEEPLLVLPYDFYEDDISHAFAYMQDFWTTEQIRMGVGGMISAEKVLKGDFSRYDGIYTQARGAASGSHAFSKPSGTYLCCYHKGTWDTLPEGYGRILKFARERNWKLTGYAYESGMNEFAISREEDYVTRILIRAENDGGEPEKNGQTGREYDPGQPQNPEKKNLC